MDLVHSSNIADDVAATLVLHLLGSSQDMLVILMETLVSSNIGRDDAPALVLFFLFMQYARHLG